MWLPKLGHKRHVASPLLSVGSLTPEEASCYGVRTLTFPFGEVSMARNWGLPPATPWGSWGIQMSHLGSRSTSPSQDHDQTYWSTWLSFSGSPDSQKLCDMINVYYFKSLGIGVICHWAAVNNNYMWSRHCLYPSKLAHFCPLDIALDFSPLSHPFS